MNLQFLYNVVEKGIAKLDIDPAYVRGEKEGQWNLKRGAKSVAVGLNSNQRFSEGFFYCTSMLVNIKEIHPSKLEPFYFTILENNASLVNMHLTVKNGWVLLVSNRSAQGLDEIEVALTINELSFFADELENQFKNTFTA